MLSIIQAFPDEFLPLFTFDGGIEAADVLKTLNVEQDCKDEVAFRMLTDYIHQLPQAGKIINGSIMLTS